ncbi:MAG TPA: enoyl-CoA hydratase-related protein [Polyangiaceae bacterium]|jgi:enoyl-CoA hydratase/carnithine racemase|nr:enoyl-CoA hydratase-related protein [Polyangiaceae bacterium]
MTDALRELVRLERREAIAVVTIDRPERMNALSRATVERIGAIGRELAADSGVRACVLTGAGDKAFCAGADLKERQGMTREQVRDMLGLYQSELGWLASSDFPTVAAINGAALGGGLELALTCDLRSATESAVLGLPETSLAIIPGAGGTQRLPRLIGEARALDLILTGRRVTAEEASKLGLLNLLLPASENLLEATLKWLEPLANGAPIAQRAALQAVRAASRLPLDQGLAFERDQYERCLQSSDREEALAAFAEKRKPEFRGQ